jgi:hypothetical protein
MPTRGIATAARKKEWRYCNVIAVLEGKLSWKVVEALTVRRIRFWPRDQSAGPWDGEVSWLVMQSGKPAPQNDPRPLTRQDNRLLPACTILRSQTQIDSMRAPP